MKTFRTTGTGSEQTLSEIESDKIPIYPSVQDIEDDLENLEEGQIVATPDTGNELAQPVDVVEKDNLHAVTSNAVSESLSYSETEQKTGGYWIDGKPIYRKIYTELAIKNTNTIVDTLTDIDKLLSARGLITSYTSSSQTTPANYITTDGSANGSWFIQIDTSKQLRANSLHDTLRITDIIIEYTKTTD